MFNILTAFALICAFLQVAPLATAATNEQQNPAQPVNAVIEWNRTLLAIVRTPGLSQLPFTQLVVSRFCTPPSTTLSIISSQGSVRTLCAFPTFRGARPK